MEKRRGCETNRRRAVHVDMSDGPSIRQYKRNGKHRFNWSTDDEVGSIRSSLDHFVDLYRHHATVVPRNSAEARCDSRQLHLIEALSIDGMSLREFATHEGVTPQAVSSRINALANRAPEFYRWWRRTNASHQHSRRWRASKR